METTTINKKETLAREITSWMKNHAESASKDGFVIGISGGVDSALVSTLCARTGLKLLCLEMPIHQGKSQVSRAKEHIDWLKDEFVNVDSAEIDLSDVYDGIHSKFKEFTSGVVSDKKVSDKEFEFTMGNTRSRMRMMALYQMSGTYNLLVAGTGNKVEDFGIGFFSKGGDGMVDLSPIADLTKTEVWELAEYLGVSKSIVDAQPTDGLHEDGRTDEQAIGATYKELEWAMEYTGGFNKLKGREKEIMDIYQRMHKANQHKMQPIPVFKKNRS